MQVLAAPVPGLEASGALVRQRGLVRRPEIGRPPEEPRDVLSEDVEPFARVVAARDALGVCREDGKVAIPPCWQVAPLHLVDLACKLGERGPVRSQELRPPASRCGAARTDAGGEMLADAGRDQKLR